jgi:hypothetical protein
MIANYHTHTRWCRHGTGEIEDYISEAFNKGLECEYYPDLLDYYARLRRQKGYEILILGHHTSADRKLDNFALTRAEDIVRYAEEVCAAIKTKLFSFVAHPDVPICGYHRADKTLLDAMAYITEDLACESVDHCAELATLLGLNVQNLLPC